MEGLGGEPELLDELLECVGKGPGERLVLRSLIWRHGQTDQPDREVCGDLVGDGLLVAHGEHNRTEELLESILQLIRPFERRGETQPVLIVTRQRRPVRIGGVAMALISDDQGVDWRSKRVLAGRVDDRDDDGMRLQRVLVTVATKPDPHVGETRNEPSMPLLLQLPGRHEHCDPTEIRKSLARGSNADERLARPGYGLDDAPALSSPPCIECLDLPRVGLVKPHCTSTQHRLPHCYISAFNAGADLSERGTTRLGS